MVLLRVALAALALGACYRPDARDCTVACDDPGDCLDGQVCGASGWCATPDVSCKVGDDAAPDPIDGAPDDARAVDGPPAPDGPPPDAAGAELRVLVSGRGKVVVEPLGVECVGTTGAPGDCTFGVAPGTEVTLVPLQTHPNYPFAEWTTANCAGETGACTVTVDPPSVVVAASFGG